MRAFHRNMLIAQAVGDDGAVHTLTDVSIEGKARFDETVGSWGTDGIL